MPLQLGTWSIITDTLGAGTLTVSSMDALGNVTGSITVPNSGQIVGFFDSGAQTVSLSNVTNPAQAFTVFTASLFQVTTSAKNQITTEYILAGTYESYPPGTGTFTGRWVASISETAHIKEKDKDKEIKEIKEIKEKEKDAKDKDIKDIKDKEKEKEIKEKEIKETLLEKGHPDSPPLGEFEAPEASLQQLEFRVAAIEDRLAAGQAFIGTDERPEVGNQTAAGDEEG